MSWRANKLLVVAALLAISAAPVSAEREHVEALGSVVESWLASPHGDYHSPSFTYWNAQGEVPVACAACHSQPGFVDFLGADGTPAGAVDGPAAINAPVGCASCHTPAAHALDAARFPSGETVAGLGPDSTCTVCHMGRQSGDAVAAATASLGEDDVGPDLAFLNVHYGVAAAVMHGADVRGGFHYPGRTYAGRFAHVPSADTCVACHDAHTTRVAVDGCMACHRGVDDVRAIRTRHGDADGDGDVSGGVHAEIEGLRGRLLDAIRLYAREVAGAPIGYAPGAFPYFFADTDGDGTIGEEEAVADNRYRAFTPRLLKAAYNYQVATKDPGAFVHNPAYVLQLLHDSLADLGTRVETGAGRTVRP